MDYLKYTYTYLVLTIGSGYDGECYVMSSLLLSKCLFKWNFVIKEINDCLYVQRKYYYIHTHWTCFVNREYRL